MAGKRERIDRRLSAASPIVLDQPVDTVVVFRDGWGEVAKRYDLGKLGLPTDIAMLLADAFRNHHAASSSDTLRHCWMALRVFARFAVEDGHVLSAGDLTTAMVGRYIAWLDQQIAGQTNKPWSKWSRANVLMQLRQMIDWTKRRHPSRLPARIDFPWRVLAGPQCRCPAHALAETTSKRSFVPVTRRSTRHGSASKRGERSSRRADRLMASIPNFAHLIRALARVNDGIMPSRRLAIRRRVNVSAVDTPWGAASSWQAICT